MIYSDYLSNSKPYIDFHFSLLYLMKYYFHRSLHKFDTICNNVSGLYECLGGPGTMPVFIEDPGATYRPHSLAALYRRDDFETQSVFGTRKM